MKALFYTAYNSFVFNSHASTLMDKHDISNSCDDASHSSISIISEDSQQSSPRPSLYNNGDISNKQIFTVDQRLNNTNFNKHFSKLPQGKFVRVDNYQTKTSLNTSIMSNKQNKNLGMYPTPRDDAVFGKTALYDTISPLRRPSEAEQKVDQLTEKIEKEMNLIGEQLQHNYQSNISDNALNIDILKEQALLKQKSPPPYYGYHHTNTPSKKLKNEFQHLPIFSKNSNSEPPQLPAHLDDDISNHFKTSEYQQQYVMENFNDKLNSLGPCMKCKQQISCLLSACQASGDIYHNECFTCFSCGRSLKDKPFYNIQDRFYCEEDYLYSGFQQTSEKCALCGHLIIEDILQALGNSYHPRCFKCHLCQLCLDGVPFTIDVHNNVYCIRDYHSLYAPKCAACSLSIVPSQDNGVTIRVVSMEKDFHVDCYKCFDCGGKLTNESDQLCYPLNGVLLCKQCHLNRLM